MRLGGRVKWLVTTMVALAASSMAAVAPALAASPGKMATGIVLSQLKLDGTRGYEVEVTAASGENFPTAVAMSASRGALRANYSMRTEFEPGIQVELGSVSTIALDFERRKRTVDRPEKGCAWITETGVFVGELRFSGELGYTSAEATSIPGEVFRLPNGFCGFGDDRPAIGLPPGIFPRETKIAARARIPYGTVRFGATMSAEGEKGRAHFLAETKESIGRLTITRSASAVAPRRGSFALNPGDRPNEARVNPPPPFGGSARLESGPGRPTWTGSLRVALPGAPTLALAGPSFAAKLCPSISLLRECTVGPVLAGR